jgi:class 3 adenylate cyclase
MIVFGINKLNSGSDDAIACAIEMINSLAPLNLEFEQTGFPPIKIGIGIHTGPVIAGEIGASTRLQYTVIGNTVNVASRLESASKECPPTVLPIVISDETAVDAGLLLNTEAETTIASLTLTNLKGLGTVKAWCIADPDGALKVLARHRDRGFERKTANMSRHEPQSQS